MSDLVTRKQRLRTLENEIRDGLLQGAEAFYYVGMKLKEIRDDELYAEGGFATWTKYCESDQLDYGRRQADHLIRAAEYRGAIGAGTSSSEWSAYAFREITRIPDLKDAARVAKKVEKQAETKGVKLSGSFVRQIVDKELDRPPRQPKAEPTPKDDGDGNVHRFLDQYTGQIEAMYEMIEENVPHDGRMLLVKNRPQVIKRLIAACNRLAGLFTR